jgi:hypothetical protein
MSIAFAASVPAANRLCWRAPDAARERGTVIADVVVRAIRRISGGSDRNAATGSRRTQRRAGGGHAVKYFSDIPPASRQCSGQQQGSINSPVASDTATATGGPPRTTAEAKQNRMPTEPRQARPHEFYGFQGKHRAMGHALFRTLFSTRTLVRIAFAALSLHCMGSAFGQGLGSGTTAPVYGTPWATARTLSRMQDIPVMASARPKARQAGAAATPHDRLHPSSRRTGG